MAGITEHWHSSAASGAKLVVGRGWQVGVLGTQEAPRPMYLPPLGTPVEDSWSCEFPWIQRVLPLPRMGEPALRSVFRGQGLTLPGPALCQVTESGGPVISSPFLGTKPTSQGC